MKHRRTLLLFVLTILLLIVAGGLWLWQEKRQYTLNRQLIAALANNDTRQALVLVEAGADPNTRCNPPPAPSLKRLLYSLLHHPTPPPANESPTAFLLACGARWGAPAASSKTAIHASEDVTLVRAMLAHHADQKARGQRKWSALQMAVWYKYRNTAQLLLEHGADVDAQEEHGRTPLMAAVAQDSVDTTRLLLEHGAHVNTQDSGGNTVLHCIQFDGPASNTLRLLLERGADPGHRNKYGKTPLDLAQANRRPDLVALLRNAGKRP